MHFSDLPLDPTLLRGVDHLGFAEPTPIQQAALPLALQGRDVLAAAMTGSGKTAAFVLPILQRLAPSRRAGLRALILTPTRELAAQVQEHLSALGRFTAVTSAAIFGGVGPAPQIRALQRGTNVIVATPGRLLDHMGAGHVRFESLEVLVLDEADRMLDMGFLPDVRRILARLPARRQTMMFSATLPPPIVELSRQMLIDPARIGVERKAAPATGVTHALLPVPEKRKRDLLVEVLKRDGIDMALVFTRTKHRANRLARHLEEAGVACDRIHGNRSQSQRQSALAAFKSGRLQVLVATDIAARGIDVHELPHVINFDVPVQPEDYIHRVGRTARAEHTGRAMTLVSPEEEPAMRAIERTVGVPLDRHCVPGFDYSVTQPSQARERPRPGSAARPRHPAQARTSRRRQPLHPTRPGAGGARRP